MALVSEVTNIVGTNLLTKFNEDPTINVAFTVLTRQICMTHNGRQTIDKRKNAPHPGGHVFHFTQTIFKRVQDIIRMNLLTKFHEDRTINVASRVLTRKNAPSPGGHVFQTTGTIFKHVQDIIRTNLLTKFHEDRTVNVASILGHVFQPTFHEDRTINVASRQYTFIAILEKNAPPPGGHVFQATGTIFKLFQNIIGTNLQTRFHDYWKINVASREKCPAPGGHVFQPTGTILKLVQDIIRMNLLTKCKQGFTIAILIHIRKNAPPLGSHVFQTNVTIFKLIPDIIKVLTRKNAPSPGGHVFQPTGITFKLVQHIIGMNLLTKNNASPLGSHVFQANVTIFKLIQDIIEINLPTKFHEDWTINVSSRVLTRRTLTRHD
ncbi:hypothetical protein DPMN_134825 [Dreissena polymorpha]|uniref:Uncharacterized protein n=1 Tax=Dreissena polymorpha TaxID=45954 RepID=A0A9D4G0T5_DREPO|nr:hypothetical protein DPMN_134825 [Dreissena polymorpha]